MAKLDSKNISDGKAMDASQILQIIEAFNGESPYDIEIKGDLFISPTVSSKGNYLLSIDETGKIFKTGSYDPQLSLTPPGGSNNQIQFNSNNTFKGNSNFTFDPTTNSLKVDNLIGTSSLSLNSISSSYATSCSYAPTNLDLLETIKNLTDRIAILETQINGSM